MPSTPEPSPDSSVDELLDIFVSESDDEDVKPKELSPPRISREPRKDMFKFRSLSELNKKPSKSPSSSPIPFELDETYIISSDEELEMSMMLMTDKISQEKK